MHLQEGTRHSTIISKTDDTLQLGGLHLPKHHAVKPRCAISKGITAIEGATKKSTTLRLAFGGIVLRCEAVGA